MSEATIQTGIQTQIQAMAEFADADVKINDWSILDQGNAAAPYVIISDADTFVSRQDSKTAVTTWEIVVTLCEAFTDWTTTLNNLRTRRQALIDNFNAVGDARSADGLAAVTVDEIRSEGPITPYYGPYLRADDMAEALPQFLNQSMIFVTQEF